MRKIESKNNSLRFVVRHLLFAVVLLVLLLFCLYKWLGHYTRHGEEIEIPQITGLSIAEAEMLVRSYEMPIVVIDSIYSNRVPLGTIVDQSPVADSKAKKGRSIYVVLNSRYRKMISLPNLEDVSYRQAEGTLRRLGIHVDSIEYVPSAYRDLVVSVKRDSVTPLEAGAQIVEGSSVILVIGQGLGTMNVTVPSLIGYSLADSKALLQTEHLTLGTYLYDVPPTDNNLDKYVVYSQTPNAGDQVLEGQCVNILLSTDLEKAATQTEQEEDENFF